MTLAPPNTPIANFLKFVECCTGTEIFFRGSLPIVSGEVYQYAGLPFPGTGGNLISGNCYTVYAEYLPGPTPYPIAPTMSSLTLKNDDCEDPDCPSCIVPAENCYLIIPCDGTEPIVTNNKGFEDYVGTFITVSSVPYDGCAYVITLEDTGCEEAITVNFDPDVPCDCELKCYYISNSNGFFYVDETDSLINISSINANPYIKVCSKIPPIFEETDTEYEVIELGLCEDDDCPTQCFKLTNCITNEEIFSTSSSLIPYLYSTENFVRILSREGCWKVSELDEQDVCDCPIDITVTSSYESCPDCIGFIAYKLTSCTTNDVIYTLLNLEAYIDQVVKLDCGCYKVEQIDYKPPNTQFIIIKLEDIYSSCLECTRTYWRLVDCAGKADSIITYTDVSSYLNKVIKIEGCDECWTVKSTDEYLNAVPVVVTENFVDCPACQTDLPCVCTVLTNYGNNPKDYVYLNCDREYVEITLNPHESTDRLCTIQWYTQGYCKCFILKLTIFINSTDFYSQTFSALAIDELEINGYPVYELCDGPTCGTVYYDGNQWVVADENNNVVYTLPNPTSDICPYGIWRDQNGNPFPPNIVLESYECPCECISLTITDDRITLNITLEFAGFDKGGYPVYTSSDDVYTITFDSQTNCWGIYINNSEEPAAVVCEDDSCPTGVWSVINSSAIWVTENCTSTFNLSTNFSSTDYFQTFGECQNGVCPPPVFKNNRTVKPGYNTPICTPEKYDMITCSFADIVYKIVLEKRYGITNCCPEEDDKWLIQKELIDLQALKDPNYNCPDCPCSCNSGKSCSTCNCEN